MTRAMILARLRALPADEQGTSVMEFGLMVTVFVGMLLGLFDLGQLAYTQAVLNGAVQEAARSSSLEVVRRHCPTRTLERRERRWHLFRRRKLHR